MTMATRGHFVWHEHMTKDPKAAMTFYSEVIGWKTQPFGDGSYTMWVGSNGPLGGVMELPAAAAQMGAPPHWMGNVVVDDVDATVTLTKKLGGKIYKEAEDIPTIGRFAVIADPQGASIAVFKPEKSMTLHDTSKQGEVCWNELITSDAKSALGFYAQLFGWTTLQEMNMGEKGTYFIYGLGDKQLGGMMNIPSGAPMPPSWMYYVQLDDLDAGMARATRMGAKITFGPMDVPTGGRIANLMDPQGAAFALHQAAKK